MTERLRVDYAWQHPNPAAIKAAGYEGVLRYLSYDPAKNLSRAEAKALHAHGLSIEVVWETTANRAGAGYAAGAHDALAAEHQADALGYPKGAVIYYAVDYNADPKSVEAYFRGIASVATRPVGSYGSRRIVEAGLAPWHWQTAAWSNGIVSKDAHLYQRVSHTHRIGGSISGWDENVVIGDTPAWLPTGLVYEPAPKPAPKTVAKDAAAPTPAPKPPGHILDAIKANVDYAAALGTIKRSPKGTVGLRVATYLNALRAQHRWLVNQSKKRSH